MASDTTAPTVDLKAASILPEPAGYRILIMMPDAEKVTEGGIIIPEDTAKREGTASIVGFVLKMGADVYSDKARFPNGPWCKEGDWVLFRAYSGTRVEIMGKEFRLINDDTVEAVVADPRGIKRAAG